MTRALLSAILVALAATRDGGVPAADFQKLHALIKPTPGEFAWYEDIPWLTSVQEARERAAAEGKPLLVWCSADGQPCGAT
jgi:hypothetical protein